MRLGPLLAIALPLLACHRHTGRNASELRASDYYPLAVGNSWTYEASFLGEKRVQEVRIVRAEDGYFLDSQGGQLTADAYGVRDHKRYLLRDPLDEGRTWTNVVSMAAVEHYKVLGRSECEVPAGKFEDCVQVEGRNRVDDKTTLVNTLTFAPGVGIVRVEVVAEVGGRRIPQTDLALKKFQVKPQAKAGPGKLPQ